MTMLDLCPRLFQGEVVEEFERIHGVRLTVNQVKQFRRTYGVRNVSGRKPPRTVNSGCFEPGHGRTGAAADLWEPVGTERLRSDGYVWVKVAEGAKRNGHFNDNWRMRSRVVYERAYGSIPEGCAIVHADGDPANDGPDNLVAVPRRLRATISKFGSPYADRETLEVAMLMARVTQMAHGAGKVG